MAMIDHPKPGATPSKASKFEVVQDIAYLLGDQVSTLGAEVPVLNRDSRLAAPIIQLQPVSNAPHVSHSAIRSMQQKRTW